MDQLLEFLREYTEFFEKMEQTQVEKLGLLMTKKLEKIEASSASAMAKMEARMNERLDSIDSELKAVRTQYITKDEFVTQIAKLTAQNDRIYDMLFDLARKGGA